jgi:hypothetical protein
MNCNSCFCRLFYLNLFLFLAFLTIWTLEFFIIFQHSVTGVREDNEKGKKIMMIRIRKYIEHRRKSVNALYLKLTYLALTLR